MMPSSIRSLLEFGSRSTESDEARAFLQKRIALFARVMLSVMLFLFLFSTVVTRILRHIDPEFQLQGLGVIRALQITIGTMLLALWLYCRRGTRPAWVLHMAESVGAILLCWAYSAIVLFIESRVRPEFMMLLATTHTLVARAAIVPSAGGATLAVGLVGTGPLVGAAYWAHLHGNSPAWLGGPLLAAMSTTVWALVAIAVTVVTSNVIYGLQRRMAEVMRLGQYTLEEKIGEGGMGEVYRASHAMLRRPTAIKLLPPEKAGAHNLARFEREVQLTSKLTHPNTVAIYDFGRTPDGLFYYAMEYLEGTTLESLVRSHGPQPAARVVHILRQISGALAEAHAAGLIHRDIKPANVILCERGGFADIVKVVDFGLVKDLGGKGDVALSNVNVLTGTPLYLSPEAITSPESLDGRADIYAVGAVGYFLLTGKTVFEGTTVVEICGHHLHTAPVAPSTRLGAPLPPRLEALILQCLAKSPAARPASARALHDELVDLAVSDLWSPAQARDAWEVHRARGRGDAAPISRRGAGEPPRPTTTVAIDLRDREAG